MTSLGPLIFESQEILNNEIFIWISQLEAFFQQTMQKIIFNKPDYDEAKFNSFKYQFEAGKIMIQDLADGLKKEFELEQEFLK